MAGAARRIIELVEERRTVVAGTALLPGGPLDSRVRANQPRLRRRNRRGGALQPLDLHVARRPGPRSRRTHRLGQDDHRPDGAASRRSDRRRRCIGGVDVAGLDDDAFRERVVAIPQDVQLFPGTVRDNVAMFARRRRRPMSSPRSRRGLGRWLDELPDGPRHRARRRRAHRDGRRRRPRPACRPGRRSCWPSPAPCCDDPTSSCSTRPPHASIPRRRPRSPLRSVASSQARTALIIAHRLETLDICDDIAVLADGALVEHRRPASRSPPIPTRTTPGCGRSATTPRSWRERARAPSDRRTRAPRCTANVAWSRPPTSAARPTGSARSGGSLYFVVTHRARLAHRGDLRRVPDATAPPFGRRCCSALLAARGAGDHLGHRRRAPHLHPRGGVVEGADPGQRARRPARAVVAPRAGAPRRAGRRRAGAPPRRPVRHDDPARQLGRSRRLRSCTGLVRRATSCGGSTRGPRSPASRRCSRWVSATGLIANLARALPRSRPRSPPSEVSDFLSAAFEASLTVKVTGSRRPVLAPTRPAQRRPAARPRSPTGVWNEMHLDDQRHARRRVRRRRHRRRRPRPADRRRGHAVLRLPGGHDLAADAPRWAGRRAPPLRRVGERMDAAHGTDRRDASATGRSARRAPAAARARRPAGRSHAETPADGRSNASTSSGSRSPTAGWPTST